MQSARERLTDQDNIPARERGLASRTCFGKLGRPRMPGAGQAQQCEDQRDRKAILPIWNLIGIWRAALVWRQCR